MPRMARIILPNYARHRCCRRPASAARRRYVAGDRKIRGCRGARRREPALDHAPGIAIRLRAEFYCAPGDHGGDAVKVIASIEDAAVIKQILEHLDWRTEPGPCLQTVRPRAAANDISGPEGARLTADPSIRTDARLA